MFVFLPASGQYACSLGLSVLWECTEYALRLGVHSGCRSLVWWRRKTGNSLGLQFNQVTVSPISIFSNKRLTDRFEERSSLRQGWQSDLTWPWRFIINSTVGTEWAVKYTYFPKWISTFLWWTEMQRAHLRWFQGYLTWLICHICGHKWPFWPYLTISDQFISVCSENALSVLGKFGMLEWPCLVNIVYHIWPISVSSEDALSLICRS